MNLITCQQPHKILYYFTSLTDCGLEDIPNPLSNNFFSTKHKTIILKTNKPDQFAASTTLELLVLLALFVDLVLGVDVTGVGGTGVGGFGVVMGEDVGEYVSGSSVPPQMNTPDWFSPHSKPQHVPKGLPFVTVHGSPNPPH